MKHIQGTSRSQTLLLPECVDDYVGPDNPVRFIEAFVDSLDLAENGFGRPSPKVTGRPGYDPADLLKLYIYGYLNRVCSSGRLEVETHRNLEVIWLMRQLQPDFKTIADFRRDNNKAFRQVFREFVVLCRSLDLFGRELIAVDGTRLKAVNNRQRNFTKAKLAKAMAESDERLNRYLKQLDDADKDDTVPTVSVEKLEEKVAAIKERRARLDATRGREGRRHDPVADDLRTTLGLRRPSPYAPLHLLRRASDALGSGRPRLSGEASQARTGGAAVPRLR